MEKGNLAYGALWTFRIEECLLLSLIGWCALNCEVIAVFGRVAKLCRTDVLVHWICSSETAREGMETVRGEDAKDKRKGSHSGYSSRGSVGGRSVS